MKSPTQQVQGIILQVRNYGEKDRMVGLMTPSHGKIQTFASSSRNSQRRFPGGLDMFVEVEAEVQRPRDVTSGLWRLLQIKILQTHLAMRKDLAKFAVGAYLSECLWGLVGEGDPQEKLFEWWSQTLQRLDGVSFSERMSIQWVLEMLSLCGYLPQWDLCVQCGRPPSGNPLFFSFEKGGICCQRCRHPEQGRWISPKMVQDFQGENFVSSTDARNVRRLLQAFIAHLLGREPKSQRIQEEIFCECRTLSSIA